VTGLAPEALLALLAPAMTWLAVRFAAPPALLAVSRALRQAIAEATEPLRSDRWYAPPVLRTAALVARGVERGLGRVAVACRRVHPVPVGVVVEVLVVVAVVA
jgi:hypothetical protein